MIGCGQTTVLLDVLVKCVVRGAGCIVLRQWRRCDVQVRFFEVSEAELEDWRERFRSGQYDINIEQKTFSTAGVETQCWRATRAGKTRTGMSHLVVISI